MFTVLLADDESIIRRGIRRLVNWEALGFSIIGETGDGLNTLDFILREKPDLVLLDIKMPEIDGLEILKRAREAGFLGKVIILSGFSDFAYAQEAFHYQVSYYLSKPVESGELQKELLSVAEQLSGELSEKITSDTYKKKAADTIIKEILTGVCDLSQINLSDLGLDSSHYQVAIYERYDRTAQDERYSFSELLRVANRNRNFFYSLDRKDTEVILLKNEYAIGKFKDFLAHYEHVLKPQKGSPLDSLFIAYGRVVNRPEDIVLSYEEAKLLLERRFFCKKGQHTLGSKAEDPLPASPQGWDEELLAGYTSRLCNYLQAANRDGILETMEELQDRLSCTAGSANEAILFMTDLLLRIREKLLSVSPSLTFPGNSQLINSIREKHYLYEISELFLSLFDLLLKSGGLCGRGTIIEQVVAFIRYNYASSIRLETIAGSFGYNTSYLGQLFSEKMGCTFNGYLDQVRIEKACELLADPSLKVYEVAELVGFKNVDYFHLKFRKLMHLSPMEYRNRQS